MGALACSTAQLAIALATDYPGGISKAISFRKHGEIDLGLAAMTATMPEFMNITGAEKRFFIAEGALITIVHELTRFPELQPKKVGLARRAA